MKRVPVCSTGFNLVTRPIMNVNVTLPKDLLEPPGAGRFTPRLILAVEPAHKSVQLAVCAFLSIHLMKILFVPAAISMQVNAAVLSTASYDEFARNTSSALGSYLYSLFPDTFTLADGTLCSGCVQVRALPCHDESLLQRECAA
eukprot:666909-Pelagomonas_calceolata.AAC.1